ncbi:COBRA-like protein 6 precursor isoform 1 [Theobroma cacao]|uniref:COBRA-like protein 6 isoform 1 n=1 Tax=Theobroma cacao TaxID=3641 RepID=A0A061F3J1_THECC|nr:COBRA-like protein 6 precursor isoform 1 [Theobroma cacao]
MTFQYRKSRSSTPTCCLPMSEFYNETIVPCPLRNWSCQAQANCVKSGAKPSLLQQLRDKQQRLPPVLRCSSHMCPIQVHWHVNHIQNYSNGNLVVFHPSLTCIFSFNYNPLNYDGDTAVSQTTFSLIIFTFNDTRIFWGIQYYNDKLLQSGKKWNVQTKLLLQKDPGIFTFREDGLSQEGFVLMEMNLSCPNQISSQYFYPTMIESDHFRSKDIRIILESDCFEFESFQG